MSPGRPLPPPPRREWAYFLDVDGTLLDLAATPGDVRLSPDTREVVRAVHALTGGAVALVSGRAIADLDAIFGALSLPVVGQHGLERRRADGRISSVGPSGPVLAGARERLARFVARHAGLLLEDKERSLALHYRTAPRLAGVVHRMVDAELRLLGDGYAIQRGKCVVELRPAVAGKGDGIDWLMQEPPFRGRVPVAIGDDATDEHSFAWVNAAGGHSIRVGPGRTLAHWRLADPRAVTTWLRQALAPATPAETSALR